MFDFFTKVFKICYIYDAFVNLYKYIVKIKLFYLYIELPVQTNMFEKIINSLITANVTSHEL